MAIKSVMIANLASKFSQKHIVDVFWKQNIAKVNRITLIPFIKNGEIYNIAYLTILEWCDNEAAYNFIQSLKNPNRETRIYLRPFGIPESHDDEWWAVQLNTHNNGDICAGTYTVLFEPEYFVKEEINFNQPIYWYPKSNRNVTLRAHQLGFNKIEENSSYDELETISIIPMSPFPSGEEPNVSFVQ